MNVLVVTNELEFFEYIEDIMDFYKPDWELSTIDSGKQCIETVKNNNSNCPDIIILDYELIDIPYHIMIEQIRDDSDIPILVISDNDKLDILVQAFNSGADEYIIRPFNKRIFIARLKALYRRRGWNMQAFERIQDKPLIQK